MPADAESASKAGLSRPAAEGPLQEFGFCTSKSYQYEFSTSSVRVTSKESPVKSYQ